MNVLAVVHGADAPPGSFGDVVRERGHGIETWNVASSAPRPEDEFEAVMIFGGSMHVDQEEHHPWLVEELEYVGRLLEERVPTLGVCLGAQLVARAAGAAVGRAREPEIGWLSVELTGDDDALLAAFPPSFEAFQWHHYAFDVPAGAQELARSRVCPQAYRLGDAWGVQFHPEVTREIVAGWVAEEPDAVPAGMLAETEERIDEWTSLGRALCAAFLEAAER